MWYRVLVDRTHFEKLVEEALGTLPDRFASRLENVSILVEDWATPEQLAKVNLKDPHRLLGLYEGIPLTERPRGYYGVLPDRITVFRIPIEEMSSTDDDIRSQVRKTVMHELGHYFGMDERRLRRTDGGS
ncbi:MAG: metallopeptidase family protein [Thermoleophilia bacterium]